MEDRNLRAPLCILANLHVPSNPPFDLPPPRGPELSPVLRPSLPPPLSLSLSLSLSPSLALSYREMRLLFSHREPPFLLTVNTSLSLTRPPGSLARSLARPFFHPRLSRRCTLRDINDHEWSIGGLRLTIDR
jgi:hypothetical protein